MFCIQKQKQLNLKMEEYELYSSRKECVYLLTPHHHQKFTLTHNFTSNICLPFHLCYSKPLLQLSKRHSHNQGVPCNHWLTKSHFVYSSKEEVFTRTSHFRLQHDQTANLCHCLQQKTTCSCPLL